MRVSGREPRSVRLACASPDDLRHPLNKTDPTGQFSAVGIAIPIIIVGAVIVAGCEATGSCQQLGQLAGDVLAGAGEMISQMHTPFGGFPTTLPIADPLPTVVNANRSEGKEGQSTVEQNRQASRAKGIPDSQIGPSGKPKVHTVQHSTTKSAEQTAEKQAPPGGRARFDAHPKDGQKPHYQAEDAKGENVKPVVHHCPPDKRC